MVIKNLINSSVLKLIIFTMLLGSKDVLSIEINGIITVLEAPIFAGPDDSTKVIQYYRRGETIYLHPMETDQDKYEELELTGNITADPQDDPFLTNELIYFPKKDSKFYKTISLAGAEAYVLKEHVLIDFKDRREFTRSVIPYDNTDYRIEEPLPKGYPFTGATTYKGMYQLGFGTSNFNSYPFVKNSFSAIPKISTELNFVWNRSQEIDPTKRFFFGAMFGIKFSSIDYLLTNSSVPSSPYIASQERTHLYIGPLASYDIYKGKKSSLNLYTSLQYGLLDYMKINIEGSNTRFYKTNLGLSQLSGVNYQSRKVIYELDTIIGSNVRFNFPRTYTATSIGTDADVWQSNASNDKFTQVFTTEVSFFAGIQYYY